MLKIAITAGLLLSPAVLLAQPSEQLGGGMGTQADAAPHPNGDPAPGVSSSHMHHASHGRHRTTRGASLSRNTRHTPNTSNSVSGPLNPMPH